MSGQLHIVGIGPGNPDQITPEARAAMTAAKSFFGYKPYLDRLSLRADQQIIASDNREELDRARQALVRAAAGETVAMISGGDAGVFAMAAAVCEAIDFGPDEWRDVDVVCVPGISAMLAVAARLGAPLGNDFCAISLSDNLKPWPVIEKRLSLAAEAGFAMALYNPISKARPWQLGRAFSILKEVLPEQTPVMFGKAIGRDGETIIVTTLSEAKPDMADMSTCILIGNSYTKTIARPGKAPLVYTPRSVPDHG